MVDLFENFAVHRTVVRLWDQHFGGSGSGNSRLRVISQQGLPNCQEHGTDVDFLCVLEASNISALNALVQRPCWYLLGASDTAVTKRCIGADVPNAEDVVLWVVLNCGKMFKRDYHNAVYVMNACITAYWWVFTIGAHIVYYAREKKTQKWKGAFHLRIGGHNWKVMMHQDNIRAISGNNCKAEIGLLLNWKNLSSRWTFQIRNLHHRDVRDWNMGQLQIFFGQLQDEKNWGMFASTQWTTYRGATP